MTVRDAIRQYRRYQADRWEIEEANRLAKKYFATFTPGEKTMTNQSEVEVLPGGDECDGLNT